MAKRRSFEEILNSEFRWPRQGDRAFVTSANPSENANIDESGQSRLVLVTDGYKTAGDLMVEAAGQDRLTRDTLVFPIIFNYRHFLEISPQIPAGNLRSDGRHRTQLALARPRNAVGIGPRNTRQIREPPTPMKRIPSSARSSLNLRRSTQLLTHTVIR